ncbi:IclR family transcriptional regulator [Actinomycetospora soli]|uniref:IclR family transcriptional regulator n=1 Tax=Actinomycetospora soli TaxID=2893887 RepID=UPI001E437D30|nr:IclR family transcriptional regulator [Actinomycetospora soli]MCD2191297.1 IclR family transcriptional regulator [Actinomycetospora soli]
MLQTVQKIGPILDLFTVERPEWGVSEVAEVIGVPRSSAHALLSSLVGTGLLQNRARGRYRIGWRVVELSDTLGCGQDVRSAAAPVLQELVHRHGETCHLAVLERYKVLYLDKVVGTHVVTVTGTRVGAAVDAHCNGVGKVLLAHRSPAEVARHVLERPLKRHTPATITTPDSLENELNAVRMQGFAIDRGETVTDVWCAAAPVRDEMGSVVAAISMTVPVHRFVSAQAVLQRAVTSAAASISRSLSAPDDGAPAPARRGPGRLDLVAS